LVNGEEVDEDFNPETVALDAIVSFSGMFCTLDGSGDKPLETHFRQWLKQKSRRDFSTAAFFYLSPQPMPRKSRGWIFLRGCRLIGCLRDQKVCTRPTE